MARLAHLLTSREVQALRDGAKSPSTPLSFFLHEPAPRIFAPTSRYVVRLGNPRSPETVITRGRLKLLPERAFRVAPHCRACARRVQAGEKVIAFGFSPTRNQFALRRAYVHLEECPPAILADANGKEAEHDK